MSGYIRKAKIVDNQIILNTSDVIRNHILPKILGIPLAVSIICGFNSSVIGLFFLFLWLAMATIFFLKSSELVGTTIGIFAATMFWCSVPIGIGLLNSAQLEANHGQPPTLAILPAILIFVLGGLCVFFGGTFIRSNDHAYDVGFQYMA